MTDLFLIESRNGQNVISARDLYEFLDVKTPFSHWIKRRIKEYGFIENVDFSSFDKNVTREIGGSTTKEYAITLSMAKELSMLEKNEKGKLARKYFIDCEERLKKGLPERSNSMNLLRTQVQVLNTMWEEFDKTQGRINLIEQKVDHVIAKTKTTPNDYYAIAGYAAITKQPVSVHIAAQIGRIAKRICDKNGYEIGSVPDPRFGRVNIYPLNALREAFSIYKGN